MSKTAIKKTLAPDVPVEDHKLIDIHRKVDKSKGGKLELSNSEIKDPVEHMKLHDNFRDREQSMNTLKTLMDDRSQIMKVKNKVFNQLDAYKRGTDYCNPVTKAFLEEQLKLYKSELHKRTVPVEKHILNMPQEKIIEAALKIRGVGPISVAYLLVYVDIHKARHASSLWAYAGYHRASHERYKKGEKSGGNKTLRVAMYNLGKSMVKSSSPYTEIYYQTKARLEVSKKITKTYVEGKKGVVEKPWCEVSKGHRDGAALRVMIKHFLADTWFVWRTLEGLDTRPLYVEEKLGHTGIIKPEERGWVY